MRNDLPGRDPYPEHEPMVWHGGADRTEPDRGDRYVIHALYMLGAGLLLLAWVLS